MKKEYVKPQNRVVVLKDKLMQPGEVISMGEGPGPGGGGDAKDYSDDSDSYSDDIWED